MTDRLQLYIDEVEKLVMVIKDLKTTDRLACSSGLLECIRAVSGSVVGWLQWLTDPVLMNHFTGDELSEILAKMKRITLNFIELDMNATRRIMVKNDENDRNDKKPWGIV